MTDVDTLIAGIYDAALDNDRWPEALAAAARLFHASHSLIYTPHVSPDHGGFFFSYNVSPDAIAAHEAHFRPLDLWTRGHASKFAGRSGGFLGEMFVSFDVLERSEFYSDFLRPQGLHHLVTSVVHQQPQAGNLLSFAMFRGRRNTAFDERYRKIAERLAPHIQRANIISERLETFELHRRVDGAMLDRASTAIFLVERTSKIVRMTETAEHLVAQGLYLRVRAGHLQAVINPAQLNLAIREVADSNGYKSFSRLLLLSEPDALERLHVLVVNAGANFRSRALVLLGPSASRRSCELADRLQSIYRLTRAEARLCELLKEGHSLTEAADALAIKRSTVVTQLKSVFLKTETNRQSNLMRVLVDLSIL